MKRHPQKRHTPSTFIFLRQSRNYGIDQKLVSWECFLQDMVRCQLGGYTSYFMCVMSIRGLLLNIWHHRLVPPWWPDGRLSVSSVGAQLSHTSDLRMSTLVAILPEGWCYRVIARSGLAGVSVWWQGEIAGFICIFYLSVAAGQTV